jgi:hypothetical protein
VYRFYARIDDVFHHCRILWAEVSGFRRIYRRAAATRHLATGYWVVSLNRRRLGPDHDARNTRIRCRQGSHRPRLRIGRSTVVAIRK